MSILKGHVHTFGNNIDTDAIIPSRYANLSAPADLGAHCMEGADPQFAARVGTGDIIVAGSNFGCGSSREVAPLSIKGAGIACVIAVSFARIFFRNAINIALPLLECAEVCKHILQNDELSIDLSSGVIRNLTQATEFKAAPYPDFLQGIITAGGLIEFTRSQKSLEVKGEQ